MARSAGTPLDGQTVVVTGAAHGIGAAAAERLHRLGANLVLLDLDRAGISELGCRLGPRTSWYETDVTDPAALRDAVRMAVERFGGIDVGIANAGVPQVGTLLASPDEDLERALTVNLLGVLRTDRALIPEIVRNGGYLLNVASLAAVVHTAANGAYAASKAGVEALTDALRVELSATRAAAGCAYFGYIDTKLERTSVEHPMVQSLQRLMPAFVRRTAPVSAAADAIERAVLTRAPRVWAPAYIGALLALRGLLQPISEWHAKRDPQVMTALQAEAARHLER